MSPKPQNKDRASRRALGETPDARSIQYLFVPRQTSSQPLKTIPRKAINSHSQRVVSQRRRLAAIQRLKPVNLPHRIPSLCHCTWNHVNYRDDPGVSQRWTISMLQPTTTEFTTFHEICSICNRPRRRRFDSTELVAVANPQIFLGAATTDPFDTTPVHMTHTIYSHLHHFREVLGPLTHPIQSRRLKNFLSDQWAPLAMTDAGMLQATIAMGAIHRLLLEGKSVESICSTDEYLTQKTMAIQVINRNLSDSRVAVSDANICAVAMLAGCESITGQAEATQIHLKGLQEMIRQRNGLGNISKTAFRQIAGLDVHTAIATSTIPQFDLCMTPDTESTWTIPINIHQFSIDPKILLFGSSLVSQEISALLSPELIDLFIKLKQIVLFTEFCRDPTYEVSPANLEYFSAQEIALDYGLLNGPALTEMLPNFPETYSPVLTDCCRLGGLLYVLTALWIFESNSAMLRGPVMQLYKVIIQNMSYLLHPDRVEYHGVLMWVLFMGSHAAVGQIERPIFITAIAGLARSIPHLQTWGDTREYLRGFLYNDRVYRVSFEAIWEQSVCPVGL